MPPSADRNLVFGLIALQMDFITREQLLDGMHAWLLEKHLPLGEVLTRRGALEADDRSALDRLVDRHIQRHRGDPQASLAAMRPEPGVCEELGRLGDAAVQASLASLTRAPSAVGDRYATVGSVVPPPGLALRYRRLRPHARGGLGEVYVATDEELHREVALKEIQERFADHPDSQARFVREAEITGNLEHPGVVPVYGLGCYPDGRRYYAMRFIRGEPMSAAIARFHRADGESKRDPGERSLSLRDLLGRFVTVCQAVGYAHSRGVIHRDLKPANVMLGEYGETLVVDWGLARALDSPEGDKTTAERPVPLGSGSGTAPTVMGQVVGTPAYMPPEQARGRLDELGPASDVFALGAMLYHLLTGQAPYTGEDALGEAQRGEVVPARQRNRRVPAALEAVCARAMAARPEGRYPTAQALAEEVGRWLADEPVTAHREPLRERARRWARRNRTLVTAGVVLLLSGVVGLSVGLWAVGREQSRTAKALDQSEQSRTEAERRFTETRAAVDEFLTEISRNDLAQLPGVQQVREQLARRAVDRYEEYARARPDDLTVQSGLARAYMALGAVISETGAADRTVATLKKAIQIQNDLCRREPEGGHRLQLARARYELAYFFWSIGQKAAARPILEETLAGVEGERGAGAEPEWMFERARCYNLLGNCDREGGKGTEAPGLFEKGRDLYRQLSDRGYRKSESLAGLSAAIHNLALDFKDRGEKPKALALYVESDQAMREAIALAPQSPRLIANRAVGLQNLATLQRDLGKQDDALKRYGEALALFRSVVEENPRVGRHQWLLASCLRDHGECLTRGKRLEEARVAFEESLRALERLIAQDRDKPAYAVDLVRGLLTLAEYHQAGTGDPISRKKYLDRAVEVGRDYGTRFPTNVRVNWQLGRALRLSADEANGAGRADEALAKNEESLDVFARRVLPGRLTADPDGVENAIRVGIEAIDLAKKKGQDARALKLIDQVLSLEAGCRTRAARADLVLLLNRQGELLAKAGRHKEAVQALTRAIRVGRPVLDEAPWHWWMRYYVTRSYHHLALTQEQLGDWRAEAAAHREYLALWGGPMHGMKEPPAPAKECPQQEAERLRVFRRTERALVPLDVVTEFGGLRQPFRVFITNVPYPKDPLEDQARWLKEERGGTLSEDVRKAVRAVHKLAHDQKGDFLQLITYQMRQADQARVKKTEEEKKQREAQVKQWRERIRLLEERLKGAKEKFAIELDLARAQADLARFIRNMDDEEARKLLKAARALVLSLLTQRPEDEACHEVLQGIYESLAESHLDKGEVDLALAFQTRRLEVCRAMVAAGRTGPKESSWKWKVASCQQAIGKLHVRAGDQGAAVGMFYAALEGGNFLPVEELGSLLKTTPGLKKLLPATVDASLNKARAELAKMSDANQVVILMQGKNPKGERIWTYLAITLRDFRRMQEAVATGKPFNPADFGKVVANGKGVPSPEVVADIKKRYTILGDEKKK